MEPTETDSLLLLYLAAADGADAEQYLTQLVTEHAEPIIQKVIGRQLGFSSVSPFSGISSADAADLRSDIVLSLIKRLILFRQQPHEFSIADFRAYVAVASYRGCSAWLRQRHPLSWRLKNKLRYLLTHQPQFCLLLNEDDEWIGGLSIWHEITRLMIKREQTERLISGSLPDELIGIPDGTFKRMGAVRQVEAIFHWAGKYIPLDDLAAILANWWGIRDHLVQFSEAIQTNLRVQKADLSTEVEQRIYLQKIWQEITQLPLRQRRAVLLNLRFSSTQSAVSLFPASGIASLKKIADCLDFPVEQLAELWDQLPLDDTKIAELIGATQRQVINLRRAARERLTRKITM